MKFLNFQAMFRRNVPFINLQPIQSIDELHDKPIDNDINNNESDGLMWKNTIPFVPPIENGMVIKVYDGDTITIASKLPYDTSPMYRFSVRLNGIDCPEIKTKNENEKKIAIIAKNTLSSMILNKQVHLKNCTTEKYGRILADVYTDDGINLNELMIHNGLAVNYNGKTKSIPSCWLEYYTKHQL